YHQRGQLARAIYLGPRAVVAAPPLRTASGAADGDRLVLGQQVGQVAVVDAGIAAAGQGQDPLAIRVGQAARTGPSTVGVDQPSRPVALEPNLEPPDLALAELQQRRRLSDGDLADQ